MSLCSNQDYRGQDANSNSVKELNSWRDKLKDVEFSQDSEDGINFEKLITHMAEVGLGINSERIKFYFNILNWVEHLTWKEYRNWKNEPKEEVLKKLIDTKRSFLERKEFLLTLMRDREQILIRENDEWNHDECNKLMAQAIAITEECIWYTGKPNLKNLNPPLIDVSLLSEWVYLIGGWANSKSKFYGEIRKLEKKLAIQLADGTVDLASDILAKPDLLKIRVLSESEKAFAETNGQFKRGRQLIAKDVKKLFLIPKEGGIIIINNLIRIN